jgi:hypothetical protein
LKANEIVKDTTVEISKATMMPPRIVPGSAFTRSQANVIASPGENVGRPPVPAGGA